MQRPALRPRERDEAAGPRRLVGVVRKGCYESSRYPRIGVYGRSSAASLAHGVQSQPLEQFAITRCLGIGCRQKSFTIENGIRSSRETQSLQSRVHLFAAS